MRDAFQLAAAQPLGAAATVLIAGEGGQAGAGTVAPGRSTKLTGDQTSPLEVKLKPFWRGMRPTSGN